MAKKDLAKKSENLSEWYNDIILKAELADYAPIKGCMVIRPYGYALWEGIQKYMDKRIKDRGVGDAYFPLFIPESFLAKEKEHVEGFSPQTAVVTYAGGEELKEKLIIRPTSETIAYQMYKKWVRSYRDLPVLINLWNNVVRWEKRTYLFLRTSEFLWQEGHCAHVSADENKAMVLWALQMYEDTYKNYLAMYGYSGVKSDSEKFPGAARTYTYEMLMPDGKALQGCTSHDLAQNFSKAIDWSVVDNKGGSLNPYQNSWGLSTRSIGGLIMVHGDDEGLILPPNAAPKQIVIVPIPGSSTQAFKFAEELWKKFPLACRYEIDSRDGETAGYKYNKWEMRGIPIRIEVGDKEAAENKVTVVRRDTNGKEMVRVDSLTDYLAKLLKEIQDNLLAQHKKFTEEHTHDADSYAEFKKIMEESKGFIRAFWCENPECEEKIKAETKATNRCLPLSETADKGKCVYCGKDAKYRWLFAQAY